MPSIGSLIVDMTMRLASFSQEAASVKNILTGLEKTADTFSKNLKRSIAGAVAGIGVGLVARDFARIADEADKGGEAAQKFGVTVEQYSQLAAGAKLAGVETTELGTAFRGLNKALAESGDKEKNASKIFEAFGIAVKDVASAADIIPDIADKFALLEDGPVKAAAAAELFGAKLGAALIPYLNQGKAAIVEFNKQLADLGIVLSTGATEAAGRFNDTMDLLGLTLDQIKRELYEVAYGPLTLLGETFLELRKGAVSAADGIEDLADTKAQMIGWAAVAVSVTAAVIDSFTLGARLVTSFGKAIGGAAAVFDRLKVLDFRGAASAGAAMMEDISDSFNAKTGGQKLLEAFDRAVDTALKGTAAKVPKGEGSKALQDALAKILAGDGKNAKKTADTLSQELKQALQIALAEFERAFAAEGTLLSDRTSFLDIALRQNLISYQEYHESKLNAQRAALEEQVRLIDAEIAVMQTTRDRLPKNEDRTQVEGQIAAALDKRTQLVRKQQVEEARGYFDLIEANKRYGDQVQQLNADLAEKQGNVGLAATMRETIRYQDLLTDAVRRNDQATVESIGKLKQYAAAQAEISKLTERSAIAREQLGIEEDRIDRDRKAGTIGELEYLRRISEARRRVVPELQTHLEMYRKLAAEQPFNERLQQDVANYEEALRKLAESTDLVADRFAEIARGGMSDFFTDLLDGTKSVKEAFHDMANSILKSVNRLVAEDISSRIFKSVTGSVGGGSTGGILSGFGGLFGGGGSSKPSSVNYENSFDKQGGGGGGAGGLLASVGSWFSSLFRAEGGPVEAGMPYIVGEKGPEWFVPRQSGTVLANGTGMGGVTQHFHIAAPADPRTQQQLGLAAYEGMMRSRRNG